MLAPFESSDLSLRLVLTDLGSISAILHVKSGSNVVSSTGLGVPLQEQSLGLGGLEESESPIKFYDFPYSIYFPLSIMLKC